MDEAGFNTGAAEPCVLWGIHGEGEGKLLEGDGLRSQQSPRCLPLCHDIIRQSLVRLRAPSPAPSRCMGS